MNYRFKVFTYTALAILSTGVLFTKASAEGASIFSNKCADIYETNIFNLNPFYKYSQTITPAYIEKKEAEINSLATLASKTKVDELTSPMSQELREKLVETLNEVLEIYLLHPNNPTYQNKIETTRFELHAYLGEWKALAAKAAYDSNHFSTAIQHAEDAIQARKTSAQIATDLGWHDQAEAQLRCINWPHDIAAQATKELSQHKSTLFSEIKEEIGELIRLKNEISEDEVTSPRSLLIRKNLVEKFNELVQTYAYVFKPHQSLTYDKQQALRSVQLHAYLAEWKALEAKAAYDQKNFARAVKEANLAITARQRASDIALELDWHEEQARQLQYMEWPTHIANQARIAL